MRIALVVLCCGLFGCSLAPTMSIDSLPGASPSSEAAHPYAWLEGTWSGEGFGGTVLETWMPASDGAMVGIFRLVIDGKPALYEIFTIAPSASAAHAAPAWEMRLRHFNADMSAWEARDAPLIWPAGELSATRVSFGPVLYERLGPDEFRATVQHGEGEATVLSLRRDLR